MAHYACECWDAEAETSYGWLEIVGIANRSAFDLTAHSKATGVDLQIRETLKEPIEVEETKLTKDAAKEIMKALKKDGKPVKEALESMSFEELRELQKQVEGFPVFFSCSTSSSRNYALVLTVGCLVTKFFSALVLVPVHVISMETPLRQIMCQLTSR